MKLFLKYAAIAIGAQILLCIVVVITVNLSHGHDSVFGVLLMFLYFPSIMLIGALGNFKGESAMIDPIMYGVPLGILIYGIIIGAIFSYLKRKKKADLKR